MPTEKKARFRLTMDKKCLMEARITVNGHSLDVATQIRQGADMDRFVVDSLLGILWNLVPEDDYRLRAIIRGGMFLRDMVTANDLVDRKVMPNPDDEHEEDDIPF